MAIAALQAKIMAMEAKILSLENDIQTSDNNIKRLLAAVGEGAVQADSDLSQAKTLRVEQAKRLTATEDQLAALERRLTNQEENQLIQSRQQTPAAVPPPATINGLRAPEGWFNRIPMPPGVVTTGKKKV